jgi:pimeloyl-ACP methyl ester carboxylesterase
MKIKIIIAVLAVLAASVFMVRAKADNVLSQPDFSGSESEPWGAYGAAIGIASGTISEFGTTTAAIGDFEWAYLGWECDAHLENNATPYWCNDHIFLNVATTTMLGTNTRAYVFQNPHQAVDGNIQLFYLEPGGGPHDLGAGAVSNTTQNLSWAWTCGPYCRSGGSSLEGTSNDFVPYFEMGPQADPPGISSLAQSAVGGAAIPDDGTVFGNSVSLSASVISEVNDPLILQVEVEPTGKSFTGIPTASSTAVVSSTMISLVISNLADGGYHWAARAVDADTSESSPWNYFSSGGPIADFTVQAPKEPVILIPGIIGSRLTRVSDGKEIWPDVDDMLLSPSDDYLDDLALAPDGSQIPGKMMAASSIIDQESVLGISASFYGKLLQDLENDGYHSGTTLFVFPYDWRLGVRNAAAALANTVAAARAASPDGKISIVAHSMGGLIVKDYLAGISDTSFVDKLVLLGAPQLGSPEAFKYLNYGDNLGFQIPVVNLDILNHNEVKKIVQNMPSIYDLLPSRAYMADGGGYVQDFRNGESTFLDFDATNRLMLADPSDSRNASLLSASDVLHGGLDNAPTNASNVYNIMGCAEPTVTGYRLYDSGVVDLVRSDGDGVVPLASAMDRANGSRNYFISGAATGISHVSLVTDGRAISLITAILDGTINSLTLPGGFSTSLDSCFPNTGSGGSAQDETTVEFSAHDVNGFTVQNSEGLSTGPDASGAINLGIPDSTYEAIGDNYFITVPAGGDYHLIAESSSSDNLVVQAQGYDGGSATQSATYVVSSTAATASGTNVGTTTAQLDFSGFDSAGNLTVTESGNASSSDGGQNATTTLSVAPIIEASSSDVTPPEMTVSGIPASVAQGSTSTVFFSATDTDSGVASLRATLDGVPIANGDTVTFAQAGENIFRVEAMDNAGNPAVKEIDFTVSVRSPREISFSPIADTYIDASVPDANHGSGQILRLRARGKNRTLVKFDQSAISSAVGSGTIISAQLTFTVAKNWENWATSELLALHRMTAPWIENGATWNTENSTSGPPWSAEPSATIVISNDTTSTVSFDVTSDIENFLADGENDGWILQKADECASGVIDFGSRESNVPPALTVVIQ